MRASLFTALAACLVLSNLPAQAKDAEAPKKAKYKVVSMVVDGKELPAEGFKDMRLIMTGNKYVAKMGDKILEEGTAKVDESKTPWAIERTATSGEYKGKTLLGIVEMKGDRLTACWAPPGKPRPKDFTSEKGSGYVLETIELIKE